MTDLRTCIASALVLGAIIVSAPAYAQCTVPNVLTNGQVADASEVMDNFNAVAACADDAADAAVEHTGTPQTGAIAVFTGPESITSGDLSGDVTTSGDTTTSLTSTGVVAGSYTNASITVDAKGRLTSATSGTVSGAGTTFTKFVVATAGDSFIDVKLDTDDGYAYHVVVKGYPSANANLRFRISSDNGVSFYSGASDYKYGSTGSSSIIGLSGSATVGSGRITIADFMLAGMNVAATEKFALTGTTFSAESDGAPINGAIGGHNNGLAANDFNAFRIFVSAGNMDNFAVYVQRIY